MELHLTGYIGNIEKGKPFFDFESFKDKVKDLQEKETLTLYINSVGGYVDDAEKIAAYLTALPNETVSVVNGLCASAATLIAIACKKRLMVIGSRYMVHNALYGEIQNCNQYCLVELLDNIKQIDKQLIDAYASKTKLDASKLESLLKEEKFFGIEEALEYGFVEGVHNSTLDKRFLENIINKIQIKNCTCMDKNTTLEDLKKEQKNFFSQVLDTIKNAFKTSKHNIQNVLLSLEGGLSVFVFSEDGELQGKKIVLAENGEPTEQAAPDGVHTFEKDGRKVSLTVEGGVITEMSEQPEDAMPNPNEEEKMAMETETEKQLAEAIADFKKTQKETIEFLNSLKNTFDKANSGKNKPMNPLPKITKEPSLWDLRAKAMIENNMSWQKAKTTVQNNIFTTDFDYVYPGKLTTDIFQAPELDFESLASLFTLMTGVRSKTQLTRAGQIEKIVQASSGCEPTFVGTDGIFSNRTLETEEMGFNLKQCANVFDNTILEELRKTDINKNDLSGTKLLSVINNVIMNATNRDLWRLAFFGDKNGASGSYNIIDGILTNIIGGVTEISNTVYSDYCTKIENASISAMNQTAGTRALDYLQALFQNAPLPLRALAPRNKVILVTPNVYYQLQNTFGSTQALAMENLVRSADGMTMSYFGVQIKPMNIWEHLLADVDNPYYGVYNTIMLYTDLSNHRIGTEDGGSLDTMMGWYERREDEYLFRSKFRLGTQFVNCDLQTISLGLV